MLSLGDRVGVRFAVGAVEGRVTRLEVPDGFGCSAAGVEVEVPSAQNPLVPVRRTVTYAALERL